jgi:hypothetical protein
MIRRHRYKILVATLLLLVAGVYVVVVSWQSGTYRQLHAMYPLSRSKNPKASEEFLKAMEYRVYIRELHPFFDYDSIVMAPLLKKMQEHFKRGKALLPEESVEDIVWWTLLYKEIHGLTVPPRDDNSLAYENLPPEEFRKVHDRVYEMIMRYPEGKVYFDIPEMKRYRFQVMAILVGFYYKRYSNRYSGKTMIDRAKKYDMDQKAVINLTNVIRKYTSSYREFIDSSKNKDILEKTFIADKIYITFELIVKYVRIYNTQKIPDKICNSDDVEFSVNMIHSLIKTVEKENTHNSKTIMTLIFDENYSNVPTVFKLLQYRCKNLEPDITQVVQEIDRLNQTMKRKER